MTDPLTEEQRQRLAVLHATREALSIELDAYDLVMAAHWVATGQALPHGDVTGLPGVDAARWTPPEAGRSDEPGDA